MVPNEENVTDWRNLTFTQALDRVVHQYGDREFLVYHNERLTYLDFKKRVDRLSKGLISIGIQKGDRVALWLPNFPEWIITQWAIAQIGSVLVSINPRYRSYDLEYFLNNAEVNTLIFTEQFKKVDFLKIIDGVCPHLAQFPAGRLQCKKIPSMKNIILVRSAKHPGSYSLDSLVEKGEKISDAELRQRQRSHSANDMVYLLYTSGTTSFPKAAVRTHDNILQHAYDVGKFRGMEPGDRVLGVIPFCGAWGASTVIPSVLLNGGCLVIEDDFDVEETFRLIQKERITIMYGVDVMYRAMLDFPGRNQYDLSTLKRGSVALFSSNTDLVKEIIDQLGMTHVAQALGMTELNACWLISRCDDPEEMRIRTIGGWLSPGLQCVVKDPETGEVLPPGQIGELCVKGYTVLPEYYRSAEETKNAFDSEGWFHTGDLGVCDGENHYSFKGRLKEMYKSHGFNVTPREMEEFLQTHPKVKAVAVIGVPDSESGETGMAFIELQQDLTATPQEIQDYCRGKIAAYKVPKHIVFLNTLPTIKSVHGDKISKPALREMAQKDLAFKSPEKK